jgi:hypothetical protein
MDNPARTYFSDTKHWKQKSIGCLVHCLKLTNISPYDNLYYVLYLSLSPQYNLFNRKTSVVVMLEALTNVVEFSAHTKCEVKSG